MKSNQLVADEIVARSKPSRDRAAPGLVAADKGSDTPARRHLRVEEDGVAGPGEAALVNLEPARTRAVAGAEGTSTLEQPDHDGALGVRPLGPGGADGVTGVDWCAQGGRGSAVATDLAVGGCRGRVVVGPLALDDIGAVAWGEALVTGGRIFISDWVESSEMLQVNLTLGS